MDRATSLYLDLVRPVAAVAVLLSHVPVLTDGHLRFFGTAGVQAVDVFFVLSGFVIAHVCATREKDVRTYSISRAARIYSVVVPALLLTAAADAIGTRIDPTAYQGWETLAPKPAIRSLLFLGEQWGSHRTPGSNGPYWSLGFEVWYYAAFGAFMFSTRPWRWLAALAVLLFIGPKVVLMFPAWLMGVVVYHICKAKALPAAAGWALTIGSLVLFTAYQFAPLPIVQQFYNSNDFVRFISLAQHYFIAMLFAANLVGFSIVSVSFAQILERHAQAIRWVAGSTFSIYLAHLPIMHLLTVSSPWPRGSILTVVLLLAATPILCLIFAELSERRKELWRRSLDAFLPRQQHISV